MATLGTWPTFACARVEKDFCAIRWTTDAPEFFMFGASVGVNLADTGHAGSVCSGDDFVTIDQGSMDGNRPDEDQFCGNRLFNE